METSVAGLTKCFAGVLWLTAGQVLLAQSGATVQGKVAGILNGEPVKQAYIALHSAGTADYPGETYLCQTDSGGQFVIRNVLPGRYELEALRAGFQMLHRAPGQNGTRVIINVPRSNASIDIGVRMIPLGVIAGRVLDDTVLDPIANASVDLVRYRYGHDKRNLTVVRHLQTDDRGQFRFFDLPPGKYRVRASNMQHDPPVLGGAREIGERTRVYETGYFGGAREASEATPLDILPGTHLESVNVRLRRVFVYAIRGITAANLSVDFLRSPDRPDFAFSTRMAAGPAGSASDRAFEFNGIPPGVYWLRAINTDPGNRGLRETALHRVEITDHDVEGVDLKSPTGISVDGLVQFAVSGSLALQTIRVVFVPENPVFKTEINCSLSPLGAFGFKGQAEDYSVSIQGPSGVYLKSLTAGGVKLKDRIVNPSELSGKLELVLATDSVKLEGTVLGADKAPVPNSQVVLIPNQNAGIRGDSTRAVETGADGRFEFAGVAPGEYKVFAFTGTELGEPLDPEFRIPFESRGTAVDATSANKQPPLTLTAIDPLVQLLQ